MFSRTWQANQGIQGIQFSLKSFLHFMFHRETIMLDPALIWQDDELKENMSCYSSDISKLKGRAQKDVLLRYYVETGKAKIKAVW